MPRLLGGIGGAARAGPWTLASKVPSLPECGNGKAAPWIRVLSDGEERKMHQLFLLCVFARVDVCVCLGRGRDVSGNLSSVQIETSSLLRSLAFLLDSNTSLILTKSGRAHASMCTPSSFFPPQVTKS